MINFYLNGQEVEVLTSPTLTTTLDETLDNAVFTLKANSNPNPIAPMQTFKIEFDDGNELLFRVATDEVSVFSTEPLLYQHKIVVTQNIRQFSKYLMRNTVFSQPPQIQKRGYGSFPYVLYHAQGDIAKPVIKRLTKENATGPTCEWVDELIITPREKISKAFFNIKSQFFIADDDNNATHIKDANPLSYVKNGNSGLNFTFKVIKVGTSNSCNVILKSHLIDTTNNIYDDTLTEFIKQNGAGSYRVMLNTDDMKYVYPLTTTPASVGGLPKNNPFAMYFQIEIGVESYYYSVYDVLDIINKQYKKSANNYEKEDLYILPSSGELYDLLTETIAPNFVFTQCTYFEALSQVFKMFDAIFTLSENKVLGIEFLNKRGATKPLQLIGRSSGIGEDKYNNGLVSYYQNALLNEKYPAANENKISFAPIRSVVLGVPEKDNSLAFIVPHKIEMINRVYIKCGGRYAAPCRYNKTIPDDSVYVNDDYIAVDLTPFVFESSIWSLLNSTTDYPLNNDYKNITQNCVITYTKGDNAINVSRYFNNWLSIEYASIWNAIKSAYLRYVGTTFYMAFALFGDKYISYPQNLIFNDLFMSVDYIANIDGRLKIESIENKYNGEMLSNQGNGSVDIEKLGLNILGLSYKLGEPTLSANQKVTNWDNAFKKGQVYIDEDGNNWVANVCTYTFMNNAILVNIQFVKNFNALSQRIQLDRQKRLSNISHTLTNKCEDDYVEYLYLTSIEPSEPLSEDMAFTINLPLSVLADMVTSTFAGNGDTKIDYARLVTQDGSTLHNVYLPIITYGSGNAICCEMSFDHPLSAGYQTTMEASGWWGEKTKTFTKIVRYTDDNGFFDKCDVYLESSRLGVDFGRQFPDMTGLNTEKVANIYNLFYYKKPNEIFALNYELICLPTPDNINTEFVGRNFITKNGIIKGRNDDKFYIYHNLDLGLNPYSIADTKGFGTRTAITNVEWRKIGFTKMFAVEFTHENIPLTKSWSICDSNGNIYFASNTSHSGTKTTIYFIPRHNRL